jgi:hypothetical protein
VTHARGVGDGVGVAVDAAAGFAVGAVDAVGAGVAVCAKAGMAHRALAAKIAAAKNLRSGSFEADCLRY